MSFETMKHGLGSLWGSVAEGWQQLRQVAENAMTRFRAGDQSQLPARHEVDDPFYLPLRGWAMLGGEVFEDDRRLVVRIEAPGLDKQDMEIEVRDDALVLKGEKRFERESSEGRWRVMQCAYGSFERVVPLSAPVLADQAKASYKNGVLRVELPKAAPGQPKATVIKID
jgi:HSP20 family protein